MNISTIYAQIESELDWRQGEIRFFQNIFSKNLNSEDQLEQARRSLIPLLYAHFEGFVKFTLLLYINIINNEKVKCKVANSSIVAASLYHVFQELRNPEKKNATFKKDLPDDTPLHRFARDKEFIEKVNSFDETIVIIPDGVVDMESNLKPVVLKKNLYKLGLDYNEITKVEGDIHKLLNFRNSIAHGSMREGIKRKDYEDLVSSTYKTMYFVKDLVLKSCRSKSFIK
ncbi:MAE_28990/MAE_18760 family HEPN-like nuclease [Fibrella sp. WM1]|uniref:MAE_28990/MAE_18760 family HEPN-like nuclease n=1 Tax=Fibrella musci TaxID=3242485 RepID=UPI003520A4B3